MRCLRRTTVTVAAGLLTLAALAACGDGEPDDSAPATSATPSVASTSPMHPESSSPAGKSKRVSLPVYYVGDQPTGPRLFREFRSLEVSGPMGNFIAALNAALAGQALDLDYRSDWPEGTTTDSVDRSSGTTTLAVDLTNDSADLSERPAGMTAAQARIAIQQLVHTVQAVAQKRSPVALSIDGKPADRVLGLSVPTVVDAGDPMKVQGTVWIIDPQDGDHVDRTFTVDGRGAFFEATVAWQLLRADKVVKQGVAMSKECCTLSPYTFKVKNVQPGDYTLRVYDADVSGVEGGREEAADTKRITVG